MTPLREWQREYRKRIAALNNEDLFDEMLDAQIPDGWDRFPVRGLWKSNEVARQARDRYTRNANRAALVTVKTAKLLERLAGCAEHLVYEYPEIFENAERDEEAALTLAARIRGALALEV